MVMAKSLNKEEAQAILTSFYQKQFTKKRVVPPFLKHSSISNDAHGLGDTVILTPFLDIKHVRSEAPSLSTLIKYNRRPPREYNWFSSPSVINISEYAKYNWGGGHAIQRIARALGLPEIYKPKGVLDSLKPTSIANRIGYHVDRGTQKHTSLSSTALSIFDSYKGDHDEYEWHNLASFTDTTNLEGLINFLSTCEYFIGINSGPMHLAAALGIKSIIIVNDPSPELLYLPRIKEVEISDLEWLYPQNVHLHTGGSNELVPFFNEDSLVDALNGNVYPYFKDDFLDIKLKGKPFDFDQFFKPYTKAIKKNGLSRSRFYRHVIPKLVARNRPLHIIETGSMWTDLENNTGAFTLIMGDLIKNWTGGKLYTVDISRESWYNCKKTTKEFSDSIEYVCSDSVSFLNKISAEHKWDLIYLDSWDLHIPDPHPSADHHLKELKVLYGDLSADTIVAVDDNYQPHTRIEWEWYNDDGSVRNRESFYSGDCVFGKGSYIHPFLTLQGWKRHVEFDDPHQNNLYCYERNP